MIIDIAEAETRLPQLIQKALSGEEILVAEAGDPVVRLTPVRALSKPRISGAWKGKGWIGKDFDAPLSDDLLDAFEGNAGPRKR